MKLEGKSKLEKGLITAIELREELNKVLRKHGLKEAEIRIESTRNENGIHLLCFDVNVPMAFSYVDTAHGDERATIAEMSFRGED